MVAEQQDRTGVWLCVCVYVCACIELWQHKDEDWTHHTQEVTDDAPLAHRTTKKTKLTN